MQRKTSHISLGGYVPDPAKARQIFSIHVNDLRVRPGSCNLKVAILESEGVVWIAGSRSKRSRSYIVSKLEDKVEAVASVIW